VSNGNELNSNASFSARGMQLTRWDIIRQLRLCISYNY